MKRIFVYILFVCIILPAKALYTDNNAGFCIADTVDIKKKTPAKQTVEKKQGKQNYGFDANKYVYQKRYLKPDSVRFSNKKFLSHFYFGFGAGLGHISKRGNYNYGLGYDYSILVGKDITKNHTLAIVAKMGREKIRKSELEMEKFAIQANYYFNFSRYFFGYNPYRLVDFSSLLAVGYQHSDIWKQKRSAVYGLLGFKTSLRIANHMHLALEPYALLASRGYNGMPKYESTKNYNFAYGAVLSLNYTINNELSEELRYAKPVYDRQYMYFEGGIQALFTDISFASSIGSYYALGYGYRFSQYFGLRATIGYSDSNWDKVTTPANTNAGHPEYNYFSKSRYFFGRAEAVLDLLSAPLKADNEKKWFSLGVTVGYENGFMWKFTETDRLNALDYGGATTSLLVKFYLPEGKAIYISPRATFANYAIPYKRPYDHIKKKYTDTRLSLAVGLELGLDKRSYVNSDNEMDDSEEFTPSMFVSATFGSNSVMTKGSYSGSPTFNKNASLSYEYRPHKIFGIRLKAGYTDHHFTNIASFTEYLDGKSYNYKGLCSITYGMFNAMLDARIDISNLIHGYNSYRRWNTSFYLGPIMSVQTHASGRLNKHELTLPGSTVVVDKKRNNGVFAGGHAALNCCYALTQRWGVFGEFATNIHDKKYIQENTIRENVVCTFNYELGVSFRIK